MDFDEIFYVNSLWDEDEATEAGLAQSDASAFPRQWFDLDSTAFWLSFDCNSTALQPFDDLRYDHKTTSVWAAALRHK